MLPPDQPAASAIQTAGNAPSFWFPTASAARRKSSSGSRTHASATSSAAQLGGRELHFHPSQRLAPPPHSFAPRQQIGAK